MLQVFNLPWTMQNTVLKLNILTREQNLILTQRQVKKNKTNVQLIQHQQADFLKSPSYPTFEQLPSILNNSTQKIRYLEVHH